MVEKRLVVLGMVCFDGLDVVSDDVLLLPSTLIRAVLVEVECMCAAWKRALFFGLFFLLCVFFLPEYDLDGSCRGTVVGVVPVCKVGSKSGYVLARFLAVRSAKLVGTGACCL